MTDFNQQIIEEFRTNDGEVTSYGFGRGLVLVHHVGAKSGTPRIAPLMGLHPDNSTWLIAASKAGAPTNPSWYYNLLANPNTTIETPDDGVVAVRAEELLDGARDEAWEQFKAASDGFRQYEEKTDRIIPVLALRRV